MGLSRRQRASASKAAAGGNADSESTVSTGTDSVPPSAEGDDDEEEDAASGTEADAPSGNATGDDGAKTLPDSPLALGTDGPPDPLGDEDLIEERLPPPPPPRKRKHTGHHIAQRVLRQGENVIMPGQRLHGFSKEEVEHHVKQGNAVPEMQTVDAE